MKKPSDDLFQLIQSLNEDEKAFIKSSISFYKKNSYNELLFDYLNKIDRYDEEQLLVDLTLLTKKGIKHNKQDLFDYLLNKLKLYYSKTDAEEQVHTLLIQAQILRKKKLYTKAEQLLDNAMQQAQKLDLFLLQGQLHHEQLTLKAYLNNITAFNIIKQENNRQIPNLLTYYNRERIYNQYRLDFTAMGFDFVTLDSSNTETIRSIYTTVLKDKQHPDYALYPDKIRLEIQFFEYRCLFALGNYIEAKKCFNSFLGYYEKSSFITDKQELLLHITNGIVISALTKDKPLLLELNEKADKAFDTVHKKEKSIDLYINYVAVKINIIAYLLRIHDFEKAKIMSEELYAQVLFNKIRKDLKKVFLGNLMQIYLCYNEPKKALKMYHAIINDLTLIHVFEDMDHTISLLALAIFFELNIKSNMESIIRSCKRNKLYEQQSTLYKNLISFFADLLKAKNAEKIKELFTSMIAAIDGISKTDNASLAIINNIEIRYWLDSKLKE